MKLTFKLIAIIILVTLSTARKLRRKENCKGEGEGVGEGEGRESFTACLLDNSGHCSNEELPKKEPCLLAYGKCLVKGKKYCFNDVVKENAHVEDQVLTEKFTTYRRDNKIDAHNFYYKNACFINQQENYLYLKFSEKVYKVKFNLEIDYFFRKYNENILIGKNICNHSQPKTSN